MTDKFGNIIGTRESAVPAPSKPFEKMGLDDTLQYIEFLQDKISILFEMGSMHLAGPIEVLLDQANERVFLIETGVIVIEEEVIKKTRKRKSAFFDDEDDED